MSTMSLHAQSEPAVEAESSERTEKRKVGVSLEGGGQAPTKKSKVEDLEKRCRLLEAQVSYYFFIFIF